MSPGSESFDCTLDCLHIDLGCPVFLQCEGISDRLKAELVGLHPGRYLIITTPSIQGQRKIPEGIREVVVRYLHRGEVLGFKAKVIDQLEKPFRLTFLTYPTTVERFNLRKSVRVSCNLPASVELAEGVYQGIITDLSLGGCRLMLRAENKMDTGLFVPEAQLDLVFQMPGREKRDRIKCAIRNANLSQDKVEGGLEFLELEDALKQAIKNYIDQVSLFRTDF